MGTKVGQGSHSFALKKSAGLTVSMGKTKRNFCPYGPDDFDFLVLCLWEHSEFLGFFVFPSAELCSRRLIGSKHCGLTVYPPWASPTMNKGQAMQDWQRKFFIGCDDICNVVKLRSLFNRQ